jgi:hypothetical protein
VVRPDRHAAPQARALPAHALFAWLYEERFGGAEAQNVVTMLALNGDLPRSALSPEQVADALLAFHAEAARILAEGRVPTGTLAAL